MTAGIRFARGVSSGWASLLIIGIIQIWQVRLARARLPDNEFALYGVISSTVAMLLIVEAGVRSAFGRLLIDARAGSESDYRSFWSSGVAVFLAQAGLIALLCAACLPFFPGWFGIPHEHTGTARTILAAQGFVTVLGYAAGFHNIALLAAQRFVIFNVATIVTSLIGALLFWVGIEHGAGLWSYILYGVPGSVFACVILPVITRRSGISRPFRTADISPGQIRGLLRLGFDLFLVSLYNLVLVNALLIFSGALLPLAVVSVVTVNLKLVQLAVQALQRVPGTADPILCQMLATGDMERFRRTWLLVAKCAIGLTLLGVGVMYLWAGFVVAKWTSPTDSLTGWELLLFSFLPLRYIVHTVCVLSGTMFKAIHRLRVPMLAELIVYAALAFTLGERWGLRGLLLANLASLILGSLIPGLRLIANHGGFRFSALFSAMLRALMPGVFIAVAIAWMLPAPESLSTAARCGFTIIWLALAGAALWFIGLSHGDRASLRSRMSARRENTGPAHP